MSSRRGRHRAFEDDLSALVGAMDDTMRIPPVTEEGRPGEVDGWSPDGAQWADLASSSSHDGDDDFEPEVPRRTGAVVGSVVALVVLAAAGGGGAWWLLTGVQQELATPLDSPQSNPELEAHTDTDAAVPFHNPSPVNIGANTGVITENGHDYPDCSAEEISVDTAMVSPKVRGCEDDWAIAYDDTYGSGETEVFERFNGKWISRGIPAEGCPPQEVRLYMPPAILQSAYSPHCQNGHQPQHDGPHEPLTDDPGSAIVDHQVPQFPAEVPLQPAVPHTPPPLDPPMPQQNHDFIPGTQTVIPAPPPAQLPDQDRELDAMDISESAPNFSGEYE